MPARVAMSGTPQMTEARMQPHELVGASGTPKSFRGFFGYLEYDFDPDAPEGVPGFGALPQPSREIAQVQVE